MKVMAMNISRPFEIEIEKVPRNFAVFSENG
jgi:hypothetical protein